MGVLVFTVNAAFVMILLAVTFARTPQRVWLSSAVVVLGLGLMSVAAEPSAERFLRDQQMARLEMVGMFWLTLLCGYCVLRVWEDIKNPPDRHDPRRRWISRLRG